MSRKPLGPGKGRLGFLLNTAELAIKCLSFSFGREGPLLASLPVRRCAPRVNTLRFCRCCRCQGQARARVSLAQVICCRNKKTANCEEVYQAHPRHPNSLLRGFPLPQQLCQTLGVPCHLRASRLFKGMTPHPAHPSQ